MRVAARAGQLAGCEEGGEIAAGALDLVERLRMEMEAKPGAMGSIGF
jgi:hypothetical protein